MTTLVAVARFKKQVGGTADFERRERPDRYVSANALGAERRLQGLGGHRSITINSRSSAISAAIASPAEHTVNEIVSPGPS